MTQVSSFKFQVELEANAALLKIRISCLDASQKAVDFGLESEASQLAAIFSTVILKMRLRLQEEARQRKRGNSNSNST